MKGIANAHIAAAKKSFTQFFYVVDADAEVHADFDFTYKPGPGDEGYVHIWHAFNPAIGLDYGYGGVKLFHKSFFKDVKSQVDFSTTLTKGIKIIPTIACTTRFNSDAFRAFRGAFREGAKLTSTAMNMSVSAEMRNEASLRYLAWIMPEDCAFKDYVAAGARAGHDEALEKDDLLFINDHDLTMRLLHQKFPEVDMTTDPRKNMTPELFFTTRIAAAMYDPYVVENLPWTELRDALSDGQLLSKAWLVDELGANLFSYQRDVQRVAILGGWIGTLALLMHARGLRVQVSSVDIDGRCSQIADKLNYDFPGFKTLTLDMYDLDYSQFDIIINTSSEHIPDIEKWRAMIPSEKLLIVQNNDFEEGGGHVSCVKNSDELRQKLKLQKVLYEGTRRFPAYSRFMLIGLT